MNEVESQDERWDRAVSGRLSKLRTMPVDTTRLAESLREQVPQPCRQARPGWFSLRSVRAVAASILLIGALGAALFTTLSRPVLASPAQMARMHEDLVAGRMPVVQVDSIDSANVLLAGQHPDSPEVPELPAEHVMACCMKSVKNKKVACVLLKREGVPVSLMVARSEDMRAPTSGVVVRDGVRYHVQASGKLNMVMTERAGRWVCLIGELPAERLVDVATQLKF